MRKFKAILCFFMCVVLPAVCLTGCLGSSDKSKQIYYAVCDDFTGMDPQIVSSSVSRAVVNNCMEGLVRVDENDEIVCAGADSIEKSNDGKIYTFHLRKTAKWYPTEESVEELSGILPDNFDRSVTAADYVFALRRAVDPATGAPDAESLRAVKNATKILSGKSSPDTLGVKAVDDFTLQIELENSDDSFLYNLTRPVSFPCNEEFFSACRGRYGLSIDYFICNGPYILWRWSLGNLVRAEKNDDYTGSVKSVVDTVWIMKCDDEKTKAEKIAAGNYDCAFISEDSFDDVADKKGYTFKDIENSVWQFTFNCSTLPFSNEKMRRAFAGTVDKKRMTDSPAGRMTLDTMNGFTKSELSPITLTDAEAQTLYGKAVKENEDIDSNSVITVLTRTSEQENVSAQAALWQKIFGIDVKTNAVDDYTAEQMYENGEYDIAYLPGHLENESCQTYLKKFTSASDENISGYKNSGYDKKYGELQSDLSDGERKNVFLELEEMLINSAAAVPVKQESMKFTMGKGVSGVQARSPGEIYFAKADIV